ncbi:NHLP bacteriocin export ABC transporter permease/ATPase subunit [Phaeacidiphilus oryzae]|uniref:NHLP bacteriocin export ABC transporter permease/ATPase subunit n=1 Tax=Phaeacidiphilus oryzae TaxID=348818 RepID=UPI00068F3857
MVQDPALQDQALQDPVLQDPVLQALDGMGGPVDLTGVRTLPLEGPQVLWLVTAGALDLFAVDAEAQGRWHYLGRLEAGALLLGPVDGPRHTLIARPTQEGAVRRIQLRELYPGYQPPLQYTEFGEPVATLLDQACEHGLARSLRVLFDPSVDGLADPAGGGPGALATADDGIEWLPVHPGSLQYGSAYSADCAQDLLIDGGLWERMVDQQSRLRHALDRWIERLERAHEDRAAAGLAAGRDARADADENLIAAIRRGSRTAGQSAGRRGGRAAADEGAVLAAARLVGEAAGITVEAPASGAAGGGGGRIDPVERIALASGCRIREVKLAGNWWKENAGPLLGLRRTDSRSAPEGEETESGRPVALLWRRGRYEAVDPAAGTRTRLGADAARRYASRAVMFYRPLPTRPLSPLRLAGFAFHGNRSDLRNLVIGGLVAVLLGTLVPLATGRVLGEYVPHAEKNPIVLTAVAVIAATVVSAFFSLLENVAVLRIEGRIEATLQSAIWDRVLRLPTRFFAGRSTGELASAAMGISSMRRVLSGISSVTVQAGTIGMVNLVMLLWFSVPLTLLTLAMLAVIAAVFLSLGLRQLWWQRKLVVLNNKLNNRAFQTLRGLPKLRVAAAESFAYAAWAEEFAKSRELQQRVGRMKNIISITNAVYLPLATLIMFMVLAGPARGSLSASAFLTFNSAVTMLLTSVTQVTNALISAVSVLPMYEQVKPILRAAPEVPAGAVAPGELTGAVEARSLTYRYSADAPLVLDDVTFSVQPGEFVAVVGASGSGKSTLLRLLIGFDAPTSGAVLYDGQDLSALDQSMVRRQCGVVLQNAQPLTGSILDCICGTEQFTLEEAWQAAEMAGLADDIRAMPMGMHTVLSDGGGSVSGGQRQRLMIAQALIRRPRILYLDEATSALDNATQRIIINSTRAMKTTRIVIAHRLSTILDADRVLVLDAGRVVQQGPPATLLADPTGPFHALTRRQLA